MPRNLFVIQASLKLMILLPHLPTAGIISKQHCTGFQILLFFSALRSKSKTPYIAGKHCARPELHFQPPLLFMHPMWCMAAIHTLRHQPVPPHNTYLYVFNLKRQVNCCYLLAVRLFIYLFIYLFILGGGIKVGSPLAHPIWPL